MSLTPMFDKAATQRVIEKWRNRLRVAKEECPSMFSDRANADGLWAFSTLIIQDLLQKELGRAIEEVELEVFLEALMSELEAAP